MALFNPEVRTVQGSNVGTYSLLRVNVRFAVVYMYCFYPLI